MVGLDHHLPRLYLRVVVHLGEVVDRASGYARGVEYLQPVIGGLLGENSIERGHEIVQVVHAVARFDEPRISRQLVATYCDTQPLPVGLVRRADVDIPVRRLERLVGSGQPVRAALWFGNVARGEVHGGFPEGVCDSALQQRCVHVLSLPCSEPVDVRGQYADRAEHARVEVADRHADLRRWAIGMSCDAHKAAHTLCDQVEPAALRVRSGCPEP